jgi:hypothetical protein
VNVHLDGPLALALAPNSDLIIANGDAINEDLNQLSEIVEFTPTGQFVGQFYIDPAVGSAFGLAVERSGGRILFAAVDDNFSVLDEWAAPATGRPLPRGGGWDGGLAPYEPGPFG